MNSIFIKQSMDVPSNFWREKKKEKKGKGYIHKQQQILNQNTTTERHEQAPLYLQKYNEELVDGKN